MVSGWRTKIFSIIRCELRDNCMKYLWETIITTYNNYHGTGKGLTLFLVSVLIIYLLNRNQKAGDDKTVNPLAFVFCPLAGIGYAFSRALNRYRAKSVPAGILTGLLIIVTLMLSGGWAFSDNDHYKTENMMHIKQEYLDVMNSMLACGEGTIRAAAPPGLSPYMKAYSGRFDVMYGYPVDGDPANLSGNARFVYEQMSLPTPDQTRFTEAVREAGYDHIVYDTQKTFFELPFEEYDYELVGESGTYKIYRDKKVTGTAAFSAAADRIRAAGTIAVSVLFVVLSLFVLIRNLRSIKDDKAEGSEESTVKKHDKICLIQILVTALIICQIAGVMIFSYDDPAGLPSGVYGAVGFTLLYSVFPALLIPAYYYAYAFLAGRLFKDKRSAWLMVLFICVLNMWGYQSKALLPATMLYCWFAPASVIIHGLLPLVFGLVIDKSKGSGSERESTDITGDDDYYKWEEEEMKNHKIINSRNLAIALILVVILFAGSVFVMNRKINSLYDTTVNLQQQVEELKKSE